MPSRAERGRLRLAEKAAKGEYELVEPLDYLILERLPDEGELVMGYYPMAATVPQLRKEGFGEVLSAGEMGGALKRLNIQGIVARVTTRGTKSFGYQRTELGKNLLKKWKSTQTKQTPDKSGDGGQT